MWDAQPRAQCALQSRPHSVEVNTCTVHPQIIDFVVTAEQKGGAFQAQRVSVC